MSRAILSTYLNAWRRAGRNIKNLDEPIDLDSVAFVYSHIVILPFALSYATSYFSLIGV